MGEPVKVDFKKLKLAITIERVLEHYGVQVRRSNAVQLVADCPLPTHTSKESRNSFKVNTEKGIWCCKSDSCSEAYKGKLGGKRGGDSLDLVALKEGVSILQAARLMTEWFGDGNALQTSPVKQNSPQKTESFVQGSDTPDSKSTGQSHPTSSPPLVNKPLSFQLKGIAYCEYLEKRGISKELAEKFGVGFFPGKGSMAGRVVIPIHNEKGELLAYCGRAIGNEEPKYKLPNGFAKSAVIYNLHNITVDSVTLTEGFFSTIKVVQAGFPGVGLMGSTLSEAQENLLRRFKFITIMLDPDEAGQRGTADMVLRLTRGHYVRVARNTKPPDEMTIDEIKNTLRYTCPLKAAR
jgi:DNA primase